MNAAIQCGPCKQPEINTLFNEFSEDEQSQNNRHVDTTHHRERNRHRLC